MWWPVFDGVKACLLGVVLLSVYNNRLLRTNEPVDQTGYAPCHADRVSPLKLVSAQKSAMEVV